MWSPSGLVIRVGTKILRAAHSSRRSGAGAGPLPGFGNTNNLNSPGFNPKELNLKAPTGEVSLNNDFAIFSHSRIKTL